MKKVLLLAIVATAFGMTSCKKDYTCECKTGSTVDFTYTQKSSKAKAKTWCTLYNTSYSASTTGGSCSLK